jgi:hypothetical protein
MVNDELSASDSQGSLCGCATQGQLLEEVGIGGKKSGGYLLSDRIRAHAQNFFSEAPGISFIFRGKFRVFRIFGVSFLQKGLFSPGRLVKNADEVRFPRPVAPDKSQKGAARYTTGT